MRAVPPKSNKLIINWLAVYIIASLKLKLDNLSTRIPANSQKHSHFSCWMCDNCFSTHLHSKVIKPYKKTMYCSLGAVCALFWGYAAIPWKHHSGSYSSFTLSLSKNFQKRTLERIRSHKMWPKGFFFLFSPVELCSWCDKNCSTSIIFRVHVTWKMYLVFGNKSGF